VNSDDIDDDNDGVLDDRENSVLYFGFETNNEGWIEDNVNDGTLNNLLDHSSDATSTHGCSPSSLPTGPSGNFIYTEDYLGNLMFFESPDDLNAKLQLLVENGEFSFYWTNGRRDGGGTQNSNSLSVLLRSNTSNTTISASIDVTGLANTGWHKFTIPLTDAEWSGTLSDLTAVLSDLDRIEIQVETILSSVV